MPKDLETLYHESDRIRRDLAEVLGRAQQLANGLADLSDPEPLDDAAVLERARMLLIAGGFHNASRDVQVLLTRERAKRLQEEMGKPKVRAV